MDRRTGRSFVLLALCLGVVASGLVSSPLATAGAWAGGSAISEALAQAEQIGERVEVEDQTTSTTIVYARPDGRLDADISAGPVRAPDPEVPGQWLPIDVTLVSDGRGIHPRVADADVSFASGGETSLATVSRDGATVGFAWPTALPQPTLTGATAIYSEVARDQDLVLLAQPDGYEVSVLVKAAPTEPLVVDLPLVIGGLTPVLESTGRLSLLDFSGTEVAFADPAVMWDATVDEAGDPSRPIPVPTELLKVGDGYELQVRPDPSFFQAPGVVYPVTVDPTTNFSVAGDTHVRSDTPTTSYGGSSPLKIGSPDGTVVMRSLIYFGTLSALTYKQIDAATLGLYETYSSSCTASEIDVYEAADSSSGSTTWNTQPPVGSLYASKSAAHGFSGCSSAWVALDTGGTGGLEMVDLVQGWAIGDANNGVVIRAASETTTSGYKKFNSAEDGSNVPTLSVTFQDADVNELLADLSLGPETAETIADIYPTAVDSTVMADCPERTYTTEEINKPFGTNGLHLDVYEPPATEGQYPAMIMVHGGGWWRGCKLNMQKEAYIAAHGDPSADLAQKFIVFNINYRLSCPLDNPYLSFTDGTDEVDDVDNLCNWRFKTTDSGTGLDGVDYGAAVHDVEEAIRFVRNHANEYCPGTETNCWNDKIELLGNSSGGNLVYEASGRLGPLENPDDLQVNAIGAWSGALRLNKLSNDFWPCQAHETTKFHNCKVGETSYTDCGRMTYPPLDGSECAGVFTDASPFSHFSDLDLPRAFFSNGTPFAAIPAANDKKEVVSLTSAQDFKEQLDANLWATSGNDPTGVYRFCLIGDDLHARSYIYNHTCVGQPNDGNIFENMVAFLEPAMG